MFIAMLCIFALNYMLRQKRKAEAVAHFVFYRQSVFLSMGVEFKTKTTGAYNDVMLLLLNFVDERQCLHKIVALTQIEGHTAMAKICS